MKQRVNEGTSLADALGQHQKIFGSLYVNMVRAGEHSGALDAVLLRLADFTESQAKLRQKIIGTMIYPAIMMVVGGGILVLLMTVVVPKVTKIFETMKATLPWTTRLLICTSATRCQNWWFIIFPRDRRRRSSLRALDAQPRRASRCGTASCSRRRCSAAWCGMLAISRFARTLATLLKSGVPLLAAMDIVKNVITNTRAGGRGGEGARRHPRGREHRHPAQALGRVPAARATTWSPSASARASWRTCCCHVADSYETQVNVRIGALTSLLEPLIIVVHGRGDCIRGLLAS